MTLSNGEMDKEVKPVKAARPGDDVKENFPCACKKGGHCFREAHGDGMQCEMSVTLSKSNRHKVCNQCRKNKVKKAPSNINQTVAPSIQNVPVVGEVSLHMPPMPDSIPAPVPTLHHNSGHNMQNPLSMQNPGQMTHPHMTNPHTLGMQALQDMQQSMQVLVDHMPSPHGLPQPQDMPQPQGIQPPQGMPQGMQGMQAPQSLNLHTQPQHMENLAQSIQELQELQEMQSSVIQNLPVASMPTMQPVQNMPNPPPPQHHQSYAPSPNVHSVQHSQLAQLHAPSQSIPTDTLSMMQVQNIMPPMSQSMQPSNPQGMPGSVNGIGGGQPQQGGKMACQCDKGGGCSRQKHFQDAPCDRFVTITKNDKHTRCKGCRYLKKRKTGSMQQQGVNTNSQNIQMGSVDVPVPSAAPPSLIPMGASIPQLNNLDMVAPSL
jgi:hypothetical protein